MTLPAFVWLLLATIWGSTWLCIKVGLDQGLPPVTFAGIRFAVAAIPLVAWLLWRRTKLPTRGADWGLMIVTGQLTFTLNYALVFWGESHISSGLAAILYTTFPIFGMLIAHFMLPAEPLTARKMGGVLLGFAGVALIFYNQVEVRGALALAGSVALVVAAGLTALAGVLIKKHGGHIDPISLTAVQMTTGFVPMLAIGIPLEGNPLQYDWTPLAATALLYLAIVGSSVTFVLLYWLMQRIEVTRTMLIPLFSTLIAVLLGTVLLGEHFGWRALVGGAAILIGLAIAIRSGHTAVAAVEHGG